MLTPHKHAKVIKAWADGLTIQIQHSDGTWHDIVNTNPAWKDEWNYRTKPEPIKIQGWAYPLLGSCNFVKHDMSHDPDWKRATLVLNPDE